MFSSWFTSVYTLHAHRLTLASVSFNLSPFLSRSLSLLLAGFWFVWMRFNMCSPENRIRTHVFCNTQMEQSPSMCVCIWLCAHFPSNRTSVVNERCIRHTIACNIISTRHKRFAFLRIVKQFVLHCNWNCAIIEKKYCMVHTNTSASPNKWPLTFQQTHQPACLSLSLSFSCTRTFSSSCLSRLHCGHMSIGRFPTCWTSHDRNTNRPTNKKERSKIDCFVLWTQKNSPDKNLYTTWMRRETET